MRISSSLAKLVALLNRKASEAVGMSGRGTFEEYHPITFAVGVFFVATGLWVIVQLVWSGVRTAIGGVFILVIFVILPIGIGSAIIHGQLKAKKKLDDSN